MSIIFAYSNNAYAVWTIWEWTKHLWNRWDQRPPCLEKSRNTSFPVKHGGGRMMFGAGLHSFSHWVTEDVLDTNVSPSVRQLKTCWLWVMMTLFITAPPPDWLASCFIHSSWISYIFGVGFGLKFDCTGLLGINESKYFHILPFSSSWDVDMWRLQRVSVMEEPSLTMSRHPVRLLSHDGQVTKYITLKCIDRHTIPVFVVPPSFIKLLMRSLFYFHFQFFENGG